MTLRLVGVAEIADIMGLSNQRVSQLWREHPLFPAPVAELRMGPVWLTDDIETFINIPRRSGRPRKK